MPFAREQNKPSSSASASMSAAHEDEDVRDGNRSMVHFKLSPNRHPLNVPKLDPAEKVWENPTHHSVWTKEEVDGVRITHLAASDVSARVMATAAEVGLGQTTTSRHLASHEEENVRAVREKKR